MRDITLPRELCGASAVARADGKFAVGVDNLTDFLRPVTIDTVAVQAWPEQIGSTLQLWNVEIRSGTTGKLLDRGGAGGRRGLNLGAPENRPLKDIPGA